MTKEELQRLISSNVDEAAEEYAKAAFFVSQQWVATGKELFKAGAEWMAGQGETLYDYINVDGKNQRWLGENLLQGDYDAGQAVIVQIRKV